ncbi:MAG: hypothetical protein WBB67_01050 [bacterium]
MKQLLIGIILLVCLANGLQYSPRIKALGTDFAWLVPDYETDLYQNPQISSKKMLGIAYDAISCKPLSIFLSSNRIGVRAKYWVDYQYEFFRNYPGWQKYSIYFEDLWLLKVKDEVWNLFNDGIINRYEHEDASLYHLVKGLEYFIGSQTSFNIGKLNIDLKIAAGFYERVEKWNIAKIYSQRVGIPSGRIGLFYTNASQVNRFTSWFVDIGGPITTAGIKSLPYSIYLDLGDYERELKYFANTFTTRIGWAKALPMGEKSFAVIGLRNDFLYQPTQDFSTGNDLQAFTNSFRIPLAVEYLINKVYLRFGTRFCYNYKNLRESTDTGLVSGHISHRLSYSYSFGLGWHPNQHLSIDLDNYEYLTNLSYWSIYIKCVF